MGHEVNDAIAEIAVGCATALSCGERGAGPWFFAPEATLALATLAGAGARLCAGADFQPDVGSHALELHFARRGCSPDLASALCARPVARVFWRLSSALWPRASLSKWGSSFPLT